MNNATGIPSPADTRLAVYGSLAPGQINHGQLSALTGSWRKGTVRGHLRPEGWGAALGFPGLVLDPAGPEVAVDLFESAELPHHWARLDEFEGTGYRRAVASVQSEDGAAAAWIYVLAKPPE
ncbi:MAG: gamma-glutamylcyclotransferase [Acidobacteria bacterium]|nr:gamma-glutamylcyclotransferase [Acidobacteriota bacterium]